MWESIKKFFGFGSTKTIETPAVESTPVVKKKTKTGSEVKETAVSVKEIKAKAKKPAAVKPEGKVAAKPAGPAKKRKPKSKE